MSEKIINLRWLKEAEKYNDELLVDETLDNIVHRAIIGFAVYIGFGESQRIPLLITEPQEKILVKNQSAFLKKVAQNIVTQHKSFKMPKIELTEEKGHFWLIIDGAETGKWSFVKNKKQSRP